MQKVKIKLIYLFFYKTGYKTIIFNIYYNTLKYLINKKPWVFTKLITDTLVKKNLIKI